MNIERQTALEYFAFGYLKGLLYDTHTGESIKGVDEWVQMDDYDMNFIGQDHAEDVPRVCAQGRGVSTRVGRRLDRGTAHIHNSGLTASLNDTGDKPLPLKAIKHKH